MPSTKSPRKGSLQFWPRKRINKFLPRVNWNAIESAKTGLKGFIVYKAGMASAEVKDMTSNSMTKDKKIVLPVTILEAPKSKIFSVRLYKDGLVKKDVLAEQFDKELKKKIKVPKQPVKGGLNSVNAEDYDNVSVIVYSIVKKTGIKKKPDMAEVGLVGSSVGEKLEFVKSNLNKELSINDFFADGELVDFRGLTKGKGLQGPVRRFGIHLKAHKSEKGVRRPGNVGPWHPARVTYRVPMAGQLGKFTRVHYNQKIISLGSNEEIKNTLKSIKNYGNVNTDYVIVAGSVQGVPKRQLLITAPLRKSKMSAKKNYEFGRLLR